MRFFKNKTILFKLIVTLCIALVAINFGISSISNADDENASASQEQIKFELSTNELLEGLEHGKIDYITFTSSSIVHHFVNRIGRENIDKLARTKLISIGEITTKTLEEYGMKVYKEAEKANMDELVLCMCENK